MTDGGQSCPKPVAGWRLSSKGLCLTGWILEAPNSTDCQCLDAYHVRFKASRPCSKEALIRSGSLDISHLAGLLAWRISDGSDTLWSPPSRSTTATGMVTEAQHSHGGEYVIASGFLFACFHLLTLNFFICRVKLATLTISQVQVPGLGTAPGIVISGSHWQLQWALSGAAALFQLEAGEWCAGYKTPQRTEKPHVSQVAEQFSVVSWCFMMFYVSLCYIQLLRKMIGWYCSDFCAVTGTVPPHSQVLPSSSAPSTEPSSSSSRSELLVSSSIEHFCPGSQMQYFHAFSLTDTRCRKWIKAVPAKKSKEKPMKIHRVRRQVETTANLDVWCPRHAKAITHPYTCILGGMPCTAQIKKMYVSLGGWVLYEKHIFLCNWMLHILLREN